MTLNIFLHRRNTLNLLKDAPTYCGIEIDVRSNGTNLIVAHDPFEKGIPLEQLLSHYAHNGLILNVKEEGLEVVLADIMRNFGITNYLFLDQSFPFMVRSLNSEQSPHVAGRVSDIESLQTIERLLTKPGYLWCDSFSGQWAHLADAVTFCNTSGSKLILVSPELHSPTRVNEVPLLTHYVKQFPTIFGVCTKHLAAWQA